MRNRALCCVTAACLAACGIGADPLPGDVGSQLPAYAAPSLAGDSVPLTSMKGSLILLNVWATWCIPCRREIPELQALHQQYSARGLRIVGVSVDDAGSDQDVANFVKDFGMTYSVLRDPDDRISGMFRIQGVPASFLIDRQGIVRWRHLGPFTAQDAAFAAALKNTL